MRRDPDIFMVGAGIRTVDHFTRETEAILRASNEVLYVDTGIATHAFLEERCPRVTDLFVESYSPGRSRLDAYHHMAARVIEAALDHSPVTFAMHGHPVVFSYTPFLIADMAKLLDLSIKVLPGISSLACLFAELMLDPGVSGIVMYEATDMLLRRRTLQPDVPTLIWQVGNLETRLHTTRPSSPERLNRFTGYLLTAYPPDHPVTAVHVSPHALIPSTVFTFPLASIGEHARALHAGVTLYLPPARTRPIVDLDLLRRIDDPEHLQAMTE
jgi:uncharacterized protein YabN with tetrapyrrole methylase and pyrophosphatase domain